MKVPFISIIIPTYERPSQLASCLQSLTQLEYPRTRFEVIVVNDGGIRPLNHLLAAFQDQLPLVHYWQPNAGPAAARNTGAARAEGSLLAFTDDDCTPAPTWLTVSAAAHEHEPTALIGGRTLNALIENPYAAMSQSILDVVYAHFNAKPRAATFFASNNMIIPVEGFRTVGGFDPRFRTSEDRDLCDRWLLHGLPMTYVPEAMVHHAHDLTLPSFWRQHYGYGRGAWRYHAARAQRRGEGFRPDGRFYRKLFRTPFEAPTLTTALRLGILLLVAQVANAAGFAREQLTSIIEPLPVSLPPINIDH